MKSSKKKALTVTLGAILMVVTIGITYAFITQILTGTKEVVVNAGVLDLVLEEENAITISDALPMYDQVGMIQEDVFNFKLVNNTSNSTNYKLKMTKIEADNELSTDDVKYYLTKEGVGEPALLSTLTDGVIDEGIIVGNDTIDYTLRLWIKDSVAAVSTIIGKTLSYRIDVEVSQETTDEEEKVDPNAVGFAIYSETDNSLRFYKRSDVPEVGDEYNGLVATGVYEDIETTNYDMENYFPEWQMNEAAMTTLKTVVIEDKISPISTCMWFALMINLETLDIEKLDTSNLTSTFNMFTFCGFGGKLNSTELDLSNWDVSKVTNMAHMFNTAGFTKINLSGWDARNVVDMSNMFCFQETTDVFSPLVEINLVGFRTKNVTNLEQMFFNARNLTSTNLDLTGFNTNNVRSMEQTFWKCKNLTTLDLSSWNTSKVETMDETFYGCQDLVTIYVSELWSVEQEPDSAYMFDYCISLVGQSGKIYNSSNIGHEFANYETGYLTYKPAPTN